MSHVTDLRKGGMENIQKTTTTIIVLLNLFAHAPDDLVKKVMQC